MIIVGHTRWKAAQKLGLEKVPVHVAKGLTPAQIKAYRIADDKSAELAEWNYDLLPIELADLQGLNFDMDLLGFSTDELAELLDPGVQEGLTDLANLQAGGGAGRAHRLGDLPLAVVAKSVRAGAQRKTAHERSS